MVVDFLSIPGWDWRSIVLVWVFVTCFEVCGLEFVCISGFRVILLFWWGGYGLVFLVWYCWFTFGYAFGGFVDCDC